MRFFRLLSATLVFALVASVLAGGEPTALAQSTDEARNTANEAQQRSEVASGLVDEAVANRDAIELQLTVSITRMNDLSAKLSVVGANLDRIASQVGYADVELAGIQSDIEHQAVNAYMTVVASPTMSVVNTETVEKALVASSVVDDVVADGKLTIGELFAKRKGLVQLKDTFLSNQQEYADLKQQVDDEIDNYTSLYAQADSAVAQAIKDADAAEAEYLEALSAVEVAKAKDAERQRQESRESTTTTTTTNPPTTSPPDPGTTSPPTTTPATTTSTSGGGGGGPWNHPPAVERWRPMVQQFFPSNRVEEALRIIDCESNGDPNAINPYSGASGLFQFLPSTWATTAPNAGYGGYSVFDPEANIASAAWLGNRYEQLGQYFWRAWNCRRMLS